jgi:hypothetical protein
MIPIVAIINWWCRAYICITSFYCTAYSGIGRPAAARRHIFAGRLALLVVLTTEV